MHVDRQQRLDFSAELHVDWLLARAATAGQVAKYGQRPAGATCRLNSLVNRRVAPCMHGSRFTRKGVGDDYEEK